jgi:hypothetical protein
MSKLQAETEKIGLYEDLNKIEREPDRNYLAINMAELTKNKRYECHEDIHMLIIHYHTIVNRKKTVKVPYKGEKTKLGIKYDCSNFSDDLVRILCNYIDVLGGKVKIDSMEV